MWELTRCWGASTGSFKFYPIQPYLLNEGVMMINQFIFAKHLKRLRAAIEVLGLYRANKVFWKKTPITGNF